MHDAQIEEVIHFGSHDARWVAIVVSHTLRRGYRCLDMQTPPMHEWTTRQRLEHISGQMQVKLGSNRSLLLNLLKSLSRLFMESSDTFIQQSGGRTLV